MSNTYGEMTTLKALLAITGATDDAFLLGMLEAVSRQIDRLTKRWFYVRTDTRYFRGQGRRIFVDDLLVVTTLKTDEDGDRTFETTWAATDYELMPLNDYPRMWIELADNGEQAGFASGVIKGVEIAGTFGYGDGWNASPVVRSTTTLGAALNATATSFTSSASPTLRVGQTILIDTEQLYITAISDTTHTVERGRNGTTAAAHDDASVIDVYQYPEEVVQAAYMQTTRLWKRKDTAFATIVGDPSMGPFEVHQGLDKDVVKLIMPYAKRRLA